MRAVGLGPVLGLVALGFSGCGGSAPSSPTPISTPAPAPSPKVAIISIDGLRPDALIQAAAPAMQGLVSRGSWTWQAQTILPSSTLPGHASMLSGYEPSVHGITWDDYRAAKGTITVPTIFSIAHEAGLRTVVVVGKEKLAHLNAPGTIDRYVITVQGDAQVASEAVTQVAAGFDLLFVHLPQTDLTGHARGWMSPSYLQQVAETDQAVGRIVSALPLETTVILTADHGGHGSTHGSSALLATTIPWVIAGPSISARGQLSSRVRTTDTAATALYVLGLSVRANATGTPVLEAFSSDAAPLSTGARTLLPKDEAVVEVEQPAPSLRAGPRHERPQERRPSQ